MAIGDDTFATRRHLPHVGRAGATYFVSFATIERRILTPAARDVTLDCCIHDHNRTYFLHCVVIMPDHAHMLFTPHDQWTLPKILRRVKGVSSRYANERMNRFGPLWQDESFDRILRSDEDVRKKAEYICANPVRAGLVSSEDQYPWIWREWIEGQRTDRQDCLSSTH